MQILVTITDFSVHPQILDAFKNQIAFKAYRKYLGNRNEINGMKKVEQMEMTNEDYFRALDLLEQEPDMTDERRQIIKKAREANL